MLHAILFTPQSRLQYRAVSLGRLLIQISKHVIFIVLCGSITLSYRDRYGLMKLRDFLDVTPCLLINSNQLP